MKLERDKGDVRRPTSELLEGNIAVSSDTHFEVVSVERVLYEQAMWNFFEEEPETDDGD